MEERRRFRFEVIATFSSMEDDLVDLLENWELTPIGNAISLAIVGKTGNGKSATGNSILGRQAFISDLSLSAVTCTSELKSTTLKDGRYVHVIDTPGLFAFSNGCEFDGREIVKCIDLAKDGLHAILMVFSINSRFTTEEAAAIQNMKTLFGDRIVDYMIVVFTGGDTLEVYRKTLNDYISRCPEPLKNIILLCKNRVIVFDNKTEDKIKRERQVKQLISLVDSVVASNGGKPFSSQIFAEVKEEALRREQMEKEIKAMEKEIEARKEYSANDLSKLKEDIYKSYDDQLKRLIETVEQKLNSTIEKLENQLAEEQVARLKAEKAAEASRLRSYEEIQKVKDELNRAREESQEFRNKLEAKADEEQVARLKAEMAAKASRLRSDEEIQKLKDELNRAREESREFRNKLETSRCAIL